MSTPDQWLNVLIDELAAGLCFTTEMIISESFRHHLFKQEKKRVLAVLSCLVMIESGWWE